MRLNYEQTVHGWKYTPSLLMLAFAPLLFFDPVIQVQELHKIFVDEIACKSRWAVFTSRFKEHLGDSNLLASRRFHCRVLACD